MLHVTLLLEEFRVFSWDNAESPVLLNVNFALNFDQSLRTTLQIVHHNLVSTASIFKFVMKPMKLVFNLIHNRHTTKYYIINIFL